MQTDIQGIYTKTILPLPEKEQMKLASLILERVTKDVDSQKTRGRTQEIFGMCEGKGLTYEEYTRIPVKVNCTMPPTKSAISYATFIGSVICQ